jgi:hypothetical protein
MPTRIILIFALAMLAHTTQAQDLMHNTVSLNITTPLIQAISNMPIDSSNIRIPTNIAYSRIVGKKRRHIIRAGIGGYNNYQFVGDDLFTDKRYKYNYQFGVMANYFAVKTINDSWQFGVGPGLSAIYSRVDNKSDSGFDVVNNYYYNRGLGVALGMFFQYRINKHIAVYTEYNVQYNAYQTVTGKSFSAFPNQDYKTSKYLNHGIQFQYPLALYINYLF